MIDGSTEASRDLFDLTAAHDNVDTMLVRSTLFWAWTKMTEEKEIVSMLACSNRMRQSFITAIVIAELR